MFLHAFKSARQSEGNRTRVTRFKNIIRQPSQRIQMQGTCQIIKSRQLLLDFLLLISWDLVRGHILPDASQARSKVFQREVLL